MKQLPTAKEFLWNGTIITQGDTEPYGRLPNDKVPLVMIEFAKLHVQQALESAAEKAYFRDFNNYVCHSEENKKSILNAYPLDNIK